MSDKYIEQIVKELNDRYEWMEDPISIVVDTNITLDDLMNRLGVKWARPLSQMDRIAVQ